MVHTPNTNWYCRDTGTLGWSGVTAWPSNTAKSAGALIRQNAAPTIGNERVFIAIVGGTTTNGTEPTWSVNKGAKTTDNTVTWQECTGLPWVNGDATNTPTWLQNKNQTMLLGDIIKDAAGTHGFIASIGGGSGNGAEPTWNVAAVGNTTVDNAVTWTYIGTIFSAWSAPQARLNNVMNASFWAVANDKVWVADDHNETSSSANTITSSGPNFIYSIDHTLSLPVTGLKSGATVTTTGSAGIAIHGNSYYNGFIFNYGTGANAPSLTIGSGNASWFKLENCAIKKLATSSNNQTLNITGGNFGDRIDFVNTTVQFGNTGDSIVLNGSVKFIWRNTASAIQGATLPTTLFNTVNTPSAEAQIEGVDFSALGSGKTLFGAGSFSGTLQLVGCKLGASVTLAASPTTAAGTVDFMNCASGATQYKLSRFAYEGTLSDETTIIRTGGASDGIQGISWKIVTTANSSWIEPFESMPMSIWNATTASNVTVTVYGIWGGGAVPNNDDIWMDVQYLGDSGSPLVSLATGTKSNNLASGSAWTSDSSTWGGSTTKFKMSVTLSSPQPQLAGYLRVYIKAATASTTFYIDSLPVLS